MAPIPQNFTISKVPFLLEDLSKIDPRFDPYLQGWSLSEIYSGQTVVIPDYVIFNYYAVYDKPLGDGNESEVSIWMGWANKPDGKTVVGLYDAEVQVNLRIENNDVLNGSPGIVKAEITKQGGDPMTVTFKGKTLTTFIDSISVSGSLFCPAKTIQVGNGYQVISDMSKYL